MTPTHHTQAVLDTTTELLSQIGFDSEIQVQAQYDPSLDLYQVSLQTTSPALLIGYHGETLAALQLILGQHLHAKLDLWLNLSLNVNDYRERREDSLHQLADSAVHQVLQTNQPHLLPPMPPGERRIIHLYLADHPQVVTASEGLGRSRSVIVSPKHAP